MGNVVKAANNKEFKKKMKVGRQAGRLRAVVSVIVSPLPCYCAAVNLLDLAPLLAPMTIFPSQVVVLGSRDTLV